MQPRSCLFPLREIVFQVTKSGDSSTALGTAVCFFDLRPREKKDDREEVFEEATEVEEEASVRVDGVEEVVEGRDDDDEEEMLGVRRRAIAAGRNEDELRFSSCACSGAVASSMSSSSSSSSSRGP